MTRVYETKSKKRKDLKITFQEVPEQTGHKIIVQQKIHLFLIIKAHDLNILNFSK